MKDFDLQWEGDELLAELEHRHANLLSPEFIAKSTPFSDLGEMLATARAQGIAIEELDDPKTAHAWTRFVAHNSVFPSWEAMLIAALKH